MTDEKDAFGDDSDWLKSQFDPTGPVHRVLPPGTEPGVPAASRPLPPPGAPPLPPSAFGGRLPGDVPPGAPPSAGSGFVPPPFAAPPLFSAPPAAPAPAAPAAPAPAPAADAGAQSGGSFNWGLRPGGTADPVPPPLVQPLAPQRPTEQAQPPAPPPVQPIWPEPAQQPPTAAPVAQPWSEQAQPPAQPPVQPIWPEPAQQPPTEAMSWQPIPPSTGGLSTQAMSWEEMTAEPAVAPAPQGQPTQAFVPSFASSDLPQPSASGSVGPASSVGPTSSAFTSEIDSLFGDGQFRQYADGVLPLGTEVLRGPTEHYESAESDEPRQSLGRAQKVLIGVAGSLVALLALLALFMLGNSLGIAPAAAPIVPVPVDTVVPDPGPLPAFGPLAPGTYAWDELLGGECLQPFESAWAEEFIVVSCDQEHVGQMIRRSEFEGDELAAYPGAEELQSQLNLLCTDSSVLNYRAAGAVSDIQISGSYPPTLEDWAEGNRTYYCFVTRESAGPLPGDLAKAPKQPKPEAGGDS